jgi:hypothetical protein
MQVSTSFLPFLLQYGGSSLEEKYQRVCGFVCRVVVLARQFLNWQSK